MKRLIPILVLSFFGIGSAFAQDFVPIKDSSNLKKVDTYVNSILELEADSTIQSSTVNNYNIIYKTSCSFFETSGVGHMVVYYIRGNFFTNKLPKDLTIYNHPLTSSGTTQLNELYICADNPLKSVSTDSIFISKNSNSMTENFVTTDLNMVSFKEFLYHNFFKTFIIGTSYDNGRFIILECAYIYNVGSQGSGGTIETIFLKNNE